MAPSKSLKKHAAFLKLLARSKPITQKSLLQAASPEVINCICEVCFNVLQNRVPLSAKQKSKLSQYKSQLRELAKKSTSSTKRRNTLQKGGFGLISSLLGPILRTVIGPLAGALTGK